MSRQDGVEARRWTGRRFAPPVSGGASDQRMCIVALFGILLVLVGLVMVAKPDLWVKAATAYCRKPYMHPVEIAICIGFGASFVLYAGLSPYPALFKVLGYMLVIVGIGLLFVLPSYHQRYGIWSVEKTAPYSRLMGIVSLAFGALLLYVALG